MKAELQVGDVFFTRIGGALGALIDFGQFVIDRREWKLNWRGRSPKSHVGIVVQVDEAWGTVQVLEAMPRGARYRWLQPEDYKTHSFIRLPLWDHERANIQSLAGAYTNKPYGFSDYLALALKHLGINFKWLDHYIANNGRMICSQLVDDILRQVGYHVFRDGRLSQDVTPGDLWFALKQQGKEL